MTEKKSCYVKSAGTNRTLLLGLGNTIRYDDAVGILAVRELRKKVSTVNFDSMELSETGLHLLSLMEGYEKVVIVDSFVTGRHEPGHIHRFDLQQMLSLSYPYSSHQLGLPSLLHFGRVLQINIPRAIIVYGLEIKKTMLLARA